MGRFQAFSGNLGHKMRSHAGRCQPMDCPVCLDRLLGSNAVWRWSCGHGIHLTCIAHMCNARPPCPICRHPWGELENVTFAFAVAYHNIDLTVSAASAPQPDQPPRQTPMAPTDIVPLCCRQLVVAERGSESSVPIFIERADRRMAWSPSFNGGMWDRSWACMRCDKSLSIMNLAPYASLETAPCCPTGLHFSRRAMMIDTATGHRFWVCTTPGDDEHEVPYTDDRCPHVMILHETIDVDSTDDEHGEDDATDTVAELVTLLRSFADRDEREADLDTLRRMCERAHACDL